MLAHRMEAALEHLIRRRHSSWLAAAAAKRSSLCEALLIITSRVGASCGGDGDGDDDAGDDDSEVALACSLSAKNVSAARVLLARPPSSAWIVRPRPPLASHLLRPLVCRPCRLAWPLISIVNHASTHATVPSRQPIRSERRLLLWPPPSSPKLNGQLVRRRTRRRPLGMGRPATFAGRRASNTIERREWLSYCSLPNGTFQFSAAASDATARKGARLETWSAAARRKDHANIKEQSEGGRLVRGAARRQRRAGLALGESPRRRRAMRTHVECAPCATQWPPPRHHHHRLMRS
jgi:hypothetical protein